MKKLYLALVGLAIPFATKAGYGLKETADEAFPSGVAATTDLPKRIGQVINGTLGLIGIIFLILAVYGGFRILLSQGDAENYKKGRDILIWAVIGVIIITLSYALTTFVFSQFLTAA